MRILGIDPGSRFTGFGVIDTEGSRLSYLASGCIRITDTSLPDRLKTIFDGLTEIVRRHEPDIVAIEKVFMARNADSALKLGQARGVVLLVPAKFGVGVSEYAPNVIKKTVVGVGHADKRQVQMMVRTLLPGCQATSADTADALAAAICHAHHRSRRDIAEMARLQPTLVQGGAS